VIALLFKLMSAVPEPIIFPSTFNDYDNVVALFNIGVTEINNDDLNVTLLLE
jgi:hypothetical protein